jgi:hypothetical protein
MESLITLSSIVGLSFAGGINLYATIALVGLCVRYNLITGLPPELYVFGNDIVIGIALILYVIEFFADKVPGLDTLWDLVHSLIRPFSGAAFALIAAGDADPVFKVVAVMVGTAVSTTTHFSKAGTRLIVNTSPEPFSNIALSFVEDIGALSIGYLAITYPYVAALVVIILLGVVCAFAPRLFRIARFWVSAVILRITSLFKRQKGSDPIPDKIWRYLNLQGPPPLVCKCLIRQCPEIVKNSRGYVIVQNDGIILVSSRWFRLKKVFLPLIEIAKVQYIESFFFIFLEIYNNEKGPVHLLFTQNRFPLVKKLENQASMLLK